MRRDRSRRLLVAALCSGYFLVLLDVTVVNVALPRIGSGLHAGGSGLAWVVDAYAVPLAALLLASGAIGDRLGHRRVVLAGFAGFGAASVLCALAQSITVLIAARALQGVGAALMLPGTLALLVDSARGEDARTRLVGVWAAVGGAALPAGPVIGGLLVQVAGWRAVFWLSVPVIAAAVVPVARLPRRREDASRGAALDWAGAALLVAGPACAVTAVIQGRGAPVPAGLLAVAAVGVALAFRRVERAAAHPLLSVPAGARRPLAVACLVAGVMNLCVLGSLFLLTQLFQDVRGLSPIEAGLATLPAMLPLPLLGAPAGRLSARFGVWRTSALSLLACTVGFAGIAAGVAGAGYTWLLPSLALWGAGLGVLTPAVVSAALQAVPGAAGTASGASNTSRQTGGALGVAVFGAVAGGTDSSGFVTRATVLFIAAAAVFALTAVLCLTTTRRPRGTAHEPPRQPAGA
jgi:DHA2 family methylenomycin A resistance protein-like MFS transporter